MRTSFSTVRNFRDEPLTIEEVSQILWAAQGITEPNRGLRTAPSPRAGFLLEVYLAVGHVTSLPMGLYRYQPRNHQLVRISEGDKKSDLFKAAGQASIQKAPVAAIINGVRDRTPELNWFYFEAGHVSQNIHLQAVSLKLGTVAMAGFKPEEVRRALNFPEKEFPLYIMPIGKK